MKHWIICSFWVIGDCATILTFTDFSIEKTMYKTWSNSSISKTISFATLSSLLATKYCPIKRYNHFLILTLVWPVLMPRFFFLVTLKSALQWCAPYLFYSVTRRNKKYSVLMQFTESLHGFDWTFSNTWRITRTTIMTHLWVLCLILLGRGCVMERWWDVRKRMNALSLLVHSFSKYYTLWVWLMLNS